MGQRDEAKQELLNEKDGILVCLQDELVKERLRQAENEALVYDLRAQIHELEEVTMIHYVSHYVFYRLLLCSRHRCVMEVRVVTDLGNPLIRQKTLIKEKKRKNLVLWFSSFSLLTQISSSS